MENKQFIFDRTWTDMKTHIFNCDRNNDDNYVFVMSYMLLIW